MNFSLFTRNDKQQWRGRLPSKAEFEQAMEQALAQRLTAANDDDDDETSSQHGEEEAGVETIGVNAIASISKKRKKSAEIEEIFEKSGSSSSSNNDRKRIAVVAKAEIKCQGTTNAHMWDVADKETAVLFGKYKLHHDREELNTDSVSSQFVTQVQNRASSNIKELFTHINAVGAEFHQIYLQNQAMGIPMFGDKNKMATPLETAVKIFCDICKKEHIGGSKHCRFKDDKGGKPPPKVENKNQDSQGGGGKSTHSKRNKSFQGNRPSVNPKYKKRDNPSGKRLRSSTDDIDIQLIDTHEQHLNTLAERDYACEYPMQVIINDNIINVNVLIDTGANASNYISQSLCDRLEAIGAQTFPVSTTVKSGISGKSQRCHVNKAINIVLSFIPEITNFESRNINKLNLRGSSKQIYHSTNAKLLPSLNYDLIVGLPSIRKMKLIQLIPSVFLDEKKVSIVDSAPRLSSGIIHHTIPATPADTICSLSETSDVVLPAPFPTSQVTWEDSDVQTRYEKSQLPGIDCDDGETTSKNILDSITFGTSTPTLTSKARKLCYEFKDIISDSLDPKPAKVDEPMEIDIEEGAWFNNPGARTPSRAQSAAKQHEIRKQLQKMIANRIIQPSQAKAWSQVLLVRKPDSKWRFCVDFRNLNAITKLTSGHPIPNIKQMLHRLGDQKAQYYATLDLTSGYFQAPLAESARTFTAFITFMGIFEFLRVPMGVKGAASYFQQFVAVTVLAGLMYICTEAYIDDVIVHGKNEDDFISNLRKVFLRFRKYNVKLQPSKMKIGLTSVEYVGHKIDKEGLHFTREKLDSVLNFQKPTYQAQLKSFLGLCNYFRDNVKHHSTLVYPLQKMLDNYDRRSKLQWTPETDAAWENIKHAVHSCPKLFFIDEFSNIHVYTDASDYGIGGYVMQIVDGKEVPIAFISKTLTESQRKWSTPQKEAFAIYYTLCKMEHLLLDRHFTIHTDHKNLTYVNDSVNAMVVRWKLYLQEYSFDILHVKGVDNIVADNFSRLCILTEENLSEEEILQFIEEDETFYSLLELHKIPKRVRRIIGKVHNSSVGHHGVERTISKIKESGKSWAHMRQHVRTFIARCPCCQLMSQVAPSIRVNPFTINHSKPMHTLAIDTIGPLPEDEKGNKYIIAIIDTFSRFLELYPVVDTTSGVAADALFQHAGRYGTPSVLISDGGSQYVNAIIKDFALLSGIHHHITLAYSKQENGIVERCNKEILRHLRAIIYEREVLNQWYKFIPMVQRIFNSTISDSIGVSPSQLIYGGALNLNRGFIFNIEDKERYDSEVDLSDYAKDMLERQAAIIAIAQKHQAQVNEKHIATKNFQYKHIDVTVFPVNSFVMVAYPNTKITASGAPHKLLTTWQGPYRVISSIGNQYTVLHLASMKEETVHVKRLKEFLVDEGVDPRQIANQATNRWDVESIVSHTGNPQFRKKMKFMVKWVGWPTPTAEPWSAELANLEVMHVYLKENKLSQMIPAKFKTSEGKKGKKKK